MECDKIQPFLLEYLRGETGAARRAEIEAHLQRCESCRRTFTHAQALWRNLELEAPPPSPALRENFQAMLSRAASAGNIRERKHRGPRLWPFLPARPVLVFSYSLFLMASGMLLGETFQPAENWMGLSLAGGGEAQRLSPERLVQLCSIENAGQFRL